MNPRLSATTIVLFVATSIVVLPAQTRTPVDITTVAQRVIEQLRNNEYAAAAAVFSEKLRAAMPEKKLQSTWEAVQKKRGRLQFTGTPVPRTARNMRSIAIPAQFEKGKLEIEVVFNASNEVAGLLLRRIN